MFQILGALRDIVLLQPSSDLVRVQARVLSDPCSFPLRLETEVTFGETPYQSIEKARAASCSLSSI